MRLSPTEKYTLSQNRVSTRKMRRIVKCPRVGSSSPFSSLPPHTNTLTSVNSLRTDTPMFNNPKRIRPEPTFWPQCQLNGFTRWTLRKNPKTMNTIFCCLVSNSNISYHRCSHRRNCRRLNHLQWHKLVHRPMVHEFHR